MNFNGKLNSFSIIEFENDINSKLKTKDDKISIISDTTIKLYNIYYEELLEIIQAQIIKLIKEFKTTKINPPNHLNYLFNQITNIQRNQLETELNLKLDQIKEAIERLKLRSNDDIIDEERDLGFDEANEHYRLLINTLNILFQHVYKNLSMIYNKNLTIIEDDLKTTINTQLTEFLSDTESDAQSKFKSNKKLKRCLSDTEMENSKVLKRTEQVDDENDDDNEIIDDDIDDEPINLFNLKQLNKSIAPLKTESKFSKAEVLNEIKQNNKISNNPRIRLGMRVFAFKKSSTSRWHPAIITRIFQNDSNTYTYCCKFENLRSKRQKIVSDNDDYDYDDDTEKLPPTHVAYSEPVNANIILPIKSRVVALYQNENEKRAPYFTAGTISEIPLERNLNRYLVFFDDGFAQYINRNEAFQIFDSLNLPKEKLNDGHLKFLCKYFEHYPEKPMVRLHKDNVLRTYYDNKWHITRVTAVDCSLVRLFFEEDKHFEWIYRGSYRLLPFYEKLKHLYCMDKSKSVDSNLNQENSSIKLSQSNENFRRYISLNASTLFPTISKQTARKSTSSSNIRLLANITPNSSSNMLKLPQQGNIKFLDLTDTMIQPTNIQFKPHPCTSTCVYKWEIDIEKRVKSLNPLLIPMIYGWQRHVSTLSKESMSRIRKIVNYRAPCGRRLRSIKEVDKYLYYTNSSLTIDMFSYDSLIHTDREFEANKTFVNIEDITYGREDVPISCVNCVDSDLPASIQYSKHRIPLDNVPLNTDENLLEGCDCTDGCRDRLKCACWRKTYEATTFTSENNVNFNVGYKGRRLLDLVSTGIFECNSKCKCDKRCSNRVVQNTISVRLQLFKTQNKGWGIRCLDDIPNGQFVSIYAGHLLTEEQSNTRGKELGDEYFADLDFIEHLKRNYFSKEDEVNKRKYSSDDETNDDEGDSFLNSLAPVKSLSMRSKKSTKDNQRQSLDLLNTNTFFSNLNNRFYDYESWSSNPNVYTMDAKVCGNIGRYFNHSCSPNMFVQNVFVDTYDLRFPWIAFFSSQFIKAGTELCWDYNYEIGSVKGRKMYCHCGSASCRGRLL